MAIVEVSYIRVFLPVTSPNFCRKKGYIRSSVQFNTNLYKCSFVVVSSVSIDALAEQSIEFLQLVDLVAFSLCHHSLQQLLKK